jgi:CTP synthase (UTP-ammonia lyase)
MIGVIGDFVPGFEPHEAIASAVGHSAAALGVEAEVAWLDTPDVESADHDGGFRIVGSDQDGEPRVLELADQRFYIATLSVPHTSSSPDEPHPLISAYVAESAGVPAANASAASRSNSP